MGALGYQVPWILAVLASERPWGCGSRGLYGPRVTGAVPPWFCRVSDTDSRNARWVCSVVCMTTKMDAKALLSAMIAEYVMSPAGTNAFDILTHGAMVIRDLSREEATEWLAEEIQERVCAMAD